MQKTVNINQFIDHLIVHATRVSSTKNTSNLTSQAFVSSTMDVPVRTLRTMLIIVAMNHHRPVSEIKKFVGAPGETPTIPNAFELLVGHHRQPNAAYPDTLLEKKNGGVPANLRMLLSFLHEVADDAEKHVGNRNYLRIFKAMTPDATTARVMNRAFVNLTNTRGDHYDLDVDIPALTRLILADYSAPTN